MNEQHPQVQMEICRAERGDLDAWVKLRHALWPDARPETLLAEANSSLSSPDEICLLLIHPASGPVGFVEGAVHSGPDEPYAHVEGWYVMPEFRRQGHGQELVGHLEQWCLHRAICLLTSDTTPEYPISPRAHARCGFRTLAQLTIFVKELHL